MNVSLGHWNHKRTLTLLHEWIEMKKKSYFKLCISLISDANVIETANVLFRSALSQVIWDIIRVSLLNCAFGRLTQYSRHLQTCPVDYAYHAYISLNLYCVTCNTGSLFWHKVMYFIFRRKYLHLFPMSKHFSSLLTVQCEAKIPSPSLWNMIQAVRPARLVRAGRNVYTQWGACAGVIVPRHPNVGEGSLH